MHTRARSYVRTLSLLTYRPAVDPSTECQIRKRRSIRSLLARSLAPSNKHVCGAFTMITRASERARPYLIGSAQTSKALVLSLPPFHSRRWGAWPACCSCHAITRSNIRMTRRKNNPNSLPLPVLSLALSAPITMADGPCPCSSRYLRY